MVKQWVKDLVERVEGPSKMVVGERTRHPDGRLVEVTDGQLWGEHGFSNFWTWRPVSTDGTLGPEEHGYGW